MNATAQLPVPSLPYTEDDSDLAHAKWAACCGHHSIAAAFNVPLARVCETFDSKKGWMSPTDIERVLHNLGIRFRSTLRMQTRKLRDGVCRVQFEGRWMNPGVPVGARYPHTHYIGVREAHVLDTAVHPAIWIPQQDWLDNADLYYVRSDVTGWHITHWYEPIQP